MGTKKRPYWRIVATDSRMARDGRFIEILGHYNPMVDPAQIKVDEDRVCHWLNKGALPSQRVGQILRKLGIMERWRLLRTGITIQELEAKIAERRLKQPKAAEGREKKKSSKKKAARAASAATSTEEAPASREDEAKA